ncbi:MAG: amino acid ABC transporter permease [Finegoldia sp.]|nr:amino acid ABC transporter permease [Finegoldia sp.]
MDFVGAFSGENLRFLLAGLKITVEVALLSVVLSTLFGIVLGTIRFHEIPVLSKVLGVVIDLIRNLPLLLIIFFTYFALPSYGIKLGIFASAVTALTIFESAMISEIIRGGFKALPKGQTEAGLASGMTRIQVIKNITLPQVLRQTTPSIVSQLIALIKDTSLATIISLPELMHNAKIIYGQNTNYVIPMFIIISIMYFVVCYLLSKVSKSLKFHI